MLVPLMLLVLGQDRDAVDAAMANYRTLTQAETPCRTAEDGDEIVVCSRRQADRYRVPFVLKANARNSVPLRTEDLTRNYARLECGQSAFTAQCGPGFGVTVSTDGSGVRMVERERAP